MSKRNVVFLEVIEWSDDSGNEVVHRVPEDGSAEIKLGAQLIVRESQEAIVYREVENPLIGSVQEGTP